MTRPGCTPVRTPAGSLRYPTPSHGACFSPEEGEPRNVRKPSQGARRAMRPEERSPPRGAGSDPGPDGLKGSISRACVWMTTLPLAAAVTWGISLILLVLHFSICKDYKLLHGVGILFWGFLFVCFVLF